MVQKSIIVCALYHFIDISDPISLRSQLLNFLQRHKIKGTIIVANEGVNGTVAGEHDAIQKMLDKLKELIGVDQLEFKLSECNNMPFLRTRVKVKKEIVTLGVPTINPAKKTGTYVSSAQWNDLIASEDVVVIDTRNHYEVAIGTFKGAIDPHTENFRDFPQYVKKNLDPSKHKKVAMFCTGGIRCEKSTAYLLEQGFEEVYHLKGGILKYLEETPVEKSLWQGECFVFDERVSVDHSLHSGSYDMCHGCRYPITERDKQSDHFQEGICCPRCYNQLTEKQRQRFSERQKQIMLAKKRGCTHLGQAV